MSKEIGDILEAALGDEGTMIHYLEVNSYTGEIPRETWNIRKLLIKLALTLLKQEVMCEWIQDIDDGSYDSQCNNKFEFLGASSPEENGFVYCPYCGKKIKVQEKI